MAGTVSGRGRATCLGWTVAFVVRALTIGAAQETNPQASALLEFNKRIAAYVQLHQQAASKGADLKETRSPTEIETREKHLSETIRSARAGARKGDIFEPVAPLLKKLVRSDWARRSPAERRALMDEVPRVARVIVNVPYPELLPLATLPPALLQELPKLPETLEYRFLGRHLILRDVTANFIVDVLENALPSSSL